MSASLPGVIDPIRSAMAIASAAARVCRCNASLAVIAYAGSMVAPEKV